MIRLIDGISLALSLACMVAVVVYGFLAVGDWAIACTAAGAAFGLYLGAWGTAWWFRRLEERYSFSCPEEAFAYYDAVVHGRVLSADEMPESVKNTLEELEDEP